MILEKDIEKYIHYANDKVSLEEEKERNEWLPLPLILGSITLTGVALMLIDLGVKMKFETVFGILVSVFIITTIVSLFILYKMDKVFENKNIDLEGNKEVSGEIVEVVNGLNKRTIVQILNNHLETIDSTKKVYITKDRKLKMVDFKALQG